MVTKEAKLAAVIFMLVLVSAGLLFVFLTMHVNVQAAVAIVHGLISILHRDAPRHFMNYLIILSLVAMMVTAYPWCDNRTFSKNRNSPFDDRYDEEFWKR